MTTNEICEIDLGFVISVDKYHVKQLRYTLKTIYVIKESNIVESRKP